MQRFFLLILMFLLNCVYSQEYLPIHSQYLLGNYFLVNPAVAGIDDLHKFRVTYRNQWIGEPMSPNTLTASYQGRINRYLGIGGYIYKDRNGFHNNTGFELALSYQINLGTNIKKKRYMSFGLAYSGRFRNLSINDLTSSDPALFSSSRSYNGGVNFGGYIIYNNYYGGVSFSKALTNSERGSIYKQTYSLIIGKILHLNSLDTFYIEPSIFFKKTQNLDIEADINAKLYFKPFLKEYKLWTGLSYKSFIDNGLNGVSLTPFFGISYKKISFGYSIDFDTSTNFDSLYNSHQFIFGLNLFEKRYNSLECSPLNF